MAGHNKWSKVKHIKAREDAKKGTIFSKFAHEVAIAARDDGGDPDLNPRLRTAIENAKSQSMPKDTMNVFTNFEVAATTMAGLEACPSFPITHDTRSQP